MIPSGFVCQQELCLKRQRKQTLTSQKLPLAKSISPLKLMVYHLILLGVSECLKHSHLQKRIWVCLAVPRVKQRLALRTCKRYCHALQEATIKYIQTFGYFIILKISAADLQYASGLWLRFCCSYHFNCVGLSKSACE